MKSQVESLLFIATKPMSAKSLHSLLKKTDAKVKLADIQAALDELTAEYNVAGRGINIVNHSGQYQFITSAENAELVKDFVKDERTGELTQPSLETLAIIAYRGPISKPLIEQIRGVNCSMILRNLMIRGLISIDDSQVETLYSVTPEFLKFLGLTQTSAMPNFEKLSKVENLEDFLAQQNADKSTE